MEGREEEEKNPTIKDAVFGLCNLYKEVDLEGTYILWFNLERTVYGLIPIKVICNIFPKLI